MKRLAIALLVTLAWPALAQQPAPAPQPQLNAEQRVRMQLGDYLIANTSLGVQLEDALRRVAELEKQLAEAKAEKPAK